jgi:hypothetical protein
MGVIGIAACYTPAQTPQAWREQMRVHRNGRVESWTISEDLTTVSDRLHRGFMECFEATTESCGGTTTSYSCAQIQYHPRAVEESPTRRTLTLQMQVNALGPARRAPQGGMYQVVVDVETDGDASRVTYYGTKHRTQDEWFAAVKDWSEAQERACPALTAQRGSTTNVQVAKVDGPTPRTW